METSLGAILVWVSGYNFHSCRMSDAECLNLQIKEVTDSHNIMSWLVSDYHFPVTAGTVLHGELRLFQKSSLEMQISEN